MSRDYETKELIGGFEDCLLRTRAWFLLTGQMNKSTE